MRCCKTLAAAMAVVIPAGQHRSGQKGIPAEFPPDAEISNVSNLRKL